MSSGQQTEKARQVRAEKRTLEDVVRALQDLIDRDLEGGREDPSPLPPAPSGAESDAGPSSDLRPQSTPPPATAPDWDADIPVLRDVVLAPSPKSDEGPPWVDAPRIALTVRRAVQRFNERPADGVPLSPAATELLEHLIFEAWSLMDADPGEAADLQGAGTVHERAP
ncbi:MAG: hypothetical protein ACYCQK_06660 [Acidiferrobacteraceae bacterium]